MPIKDYILREIEKISILLQYLLGKYVPAKSLQEVQKTEALINKELKEQYGHDLNDILVIDKKDYESVFTKNKGFNDTNTELLADLLFTLGNDEFSKNEKYLNKALELYHYIDLSTKTFSFERTAKINTLNEILEKP